MLDMTWQRKSLFEQIWMIKLLGHRMGTRMMGLAPRPPFSQANFGLGPASGLSRFSFWNFLSCFAQAIFGLGPNCWALPIFLFLYFFVWMFLFSFFFFLCQHPGYPLYDMRIYLILYNFWQVRIPYSAFSLEGTHWSFKTIPSGVQACVKMIPSFKEGLKGWKKRGIIFARECS